MALSELQRNTLQKSRLILIADLDVDSIVNHLVSSDVLEESDEGKICAKATQRTQVLAFLSILRKKGAAKYEIFLSVLQDKQPHLAKKLEENEQQLRQSRSLGHSTDIPMLDEHRSILKQSRLFLIENLDIDSIIDYLMAEFVLTMQDEEKIKKEQLPSNKVATLTQILARRGETAYSSFLAGLQLHQSFIYEELLKKEGIKAAGDQRSNVQPVEDSVNVSTSNSEPLPFLPFDGGAGPSPSNPSNTPVNLAAQSSCPSLANSAFKQPATSASANQISGLQDTRSKDTDVPNLLSEVQEDEDIVKGNKSHTELDTGRRRAPSESESYDILLVHSLQDVETDIYNDLSQFFMESKLSVISVHELPAGKDEFSNFYTMLDSCRYTVCLLTSRFVEDVWCDKRHVMACERAVRERKESVFHVKTKGFNDKDIPAGLKGITGVEHANPFFKSALKNTFKRKKKSDDQPSSVKSGLSRVSESDGSVKPPSSTRSEPLVSSSPIHEGLHSPGSQQNRGECSDYPTLPNTAIVNPASSSFQNSEVQDTSGGESSTASASEHSEHPQNRDIVEESSAQLEATPNQNPNNSHSDISTSDGKSGEESTSNAAAAAAGVCQSEDNSNAESGAQPEASGSEEEQNKGSGSEGESDEESTAVASTSGACKNANSTNGSEDIPDASQGPGPEGQSQKKNLKEMLKGAKTKLKKGPSLFKKPLSEVIAMEFDIDNPSVRRTTEMPSVTSHTLNNTSRIDQTSKVSESESETCTQTFEWHWKDCIELGAEAQFETGIPCIANGQLKLGLKNQFFIGQNRGSANSKTKSRILDLPLTAAPNTSASADAIILKHEIEVPFTATIKKGSKTKEKKGVFKSVQYEVTSNYTDKELSKTDS